MSKIGNNLGEVGIKELGLVNGNEVNLWSSGEDVVNIFWSLIGNRNGDMFAASARANNIGSKAVIVIWFEDQTFASGGLGGKNVVEHKESFFGKHGTDVAGN